MLLKSWAKAAGQGPDDLHLLGLPQVAFSFFNKAL
jgi:hypothetical protein